MLERMSQRGESEPEEDDAGQASAQLEAVLQTMERDGYAFAVEKNWNGTSDVHTLTTKSGKGPLYATLVPASTRWAELCDEGTNGQTLPSGATIDAKGAKYTLTIELGEASLEASVPDAERRSALAEAQQRQLTYYQTMVSEYWEWVWDHADSDAAVKAVKADLLKQTKAVLAMAHKKSVSAMADDDPAVQEMARQRFVENAVSPFGTTPDGVAATVKASQKVFLKAGGQRPPPPVCDVDDAPLNADDTSTQWARRGALVKPRVRFSAWAFAGRYGIRADLVRVNVLTRGEPPAKKRRLRDDSCSAYADC